MMGVIMTKAGEAKVLIETVDTKSPESFPGMTDTADLEMARDKIYDVFESAKSVIEGIAQEFSEIITSGAVSPDEAKISFGMSVTAEGNLWLIKSGGDMSMNVELTWKLGDKDE